MKIKNTFLVTGGCGFIGSFLIRHLLEDETNKVINIDKISYASNKDSIKVKDKSRYILLEKDINTPGIIKEILNRYNPNYIIHMAAESHVDRSIDNPENFIFSNVIGTYTMLHSSHKYWVSLKKDDAQKFKFLYISTDEVYGSIIDKTLFFTEESNIKPNSPYAASKASGDILVRSWGKTYGLPVITTNSSNNYGIWQFPEKLIPLVIKKCLMEEGIPIYGDGKQIRDWINVEDNIRGILAVLEKGKLGEKYNIGGNNEITNLEIVKNICSILDDINPREKGKYSDLIEFVKDRPAHDLRYALNIEKILKDTNWKPKIKFEDGIKDTINWYLSNRDWLFYKTEDRYNGDRLGNIKE